MGLASVDLEFGIRSVAARLSEFASNGYHEMHRLCNCHSLTVRDFGFGESLSDG